ncbi:MAG TPA: hypothetical protein IAA58_02210 [Candidatus Gallacutalibacter stercoravium]|nr:hypothetical protein [Candidatus Gallacutalibacter stercoravium]
MMEYKLGPCWIRMSFWFVASVAFAVLFDTDGFALYGLLAAVLHECGHIAAMCCWKTPPKSIHCGMCCIDIEDPARGMRGYRRDIGVLLAGPLVNMIAGAILFLPSWWCQSPRFMTAALTQGVTGLFNLLPVPTLDGGQILYSWLCLHGQAQRAARIATVCGVLVLLPVAVAGFLLLLRSKYNYSLLLLACYLMAAMLLKEDAYY